MNRDIEAEKSKYLKIIRESREQLQGNIFETLDTPYNF